MAKMSGREVLEAIQAGLLAPPPMARLIGFHIVAGARSATLHLNVSYLRGLSFRSGTITAKGRVVRLTRSAALWKGW